ncbi:hypothetical protein LX15_004812 [Streptoalloteichus tenebrarius]|uniref:Uncharacterized protein n=1 Tax=Streptoalloteichus tenebrarius (strain ATCC 17920 / DSM 40477 / JCM 4838 / CBS 697.72 / NBRC 16177 / NCIMB 11028 / NRRL B-12390 / A12253. 1 / ISP 5477) TaxID=1933 RepID=A0ABT1HZY0_STRSD|nr:hypothetical protein [Streptoalloteichus tenebrarius]MCP2261092.1 hypothetical protein [Streptoalloteichus tenebrarius]BFF03111.1 hypothetical protein GCM10020241_47860 [Streptoalloteichus tenebrarius]
MSISPELVLAAIGSLGTALSTWQTARTARVRAELRALRAEVAELLSWQLGARAYIRRLLGVLIDRGIDPPPPPEALGLLDDRRSA